MSTRLPSRVDRFIGRERDISAITSALRSTRLITLAGPGGVGKTRLALEIARRRGAGAQVNFVDLSPLRDAHQVPAAIARAMGLGSSVSQSPASLVELLQGTTGLLVVDNCEHIIDAVAASVRAILEGCAGIRILATSRESLQVPGETRWPLEPLPPDEAVRLFQDRANSVRPGSMHGSEAVVAAICARLEGVPLAIELAAALALALPPETILVRLEERLEDLAVSGRGLPLRQRSLRAAMQWSYDLLSPEEQRDFYRIAVFPASFSLEAAEAVAGVDATGLGSLVSKSLVSVVTGAAGTRYALLEMLREFGVAHLQASGEAEPLRARHLDYFVTLARGTFASGSAGGAEPAVRALGRDLDNLRFALTWAIDHDHAAGASLVGCSREVWLRHDQAQGLSWATRLLALHRSPDEARALALIAAGVLSVAHQDTRTAMEWLTEALSVGQAMGRNDLAAAVHLYIGTAAMLAQDLGKAEGELNRGLELSRSLADAVGEGRTLGILGVVRFLKRDFEGAVPVLDRALSLLRPRDDAWGTGQALTYLGLTARAAGDPRGARAHLADAIQTLLPTADLTILGIALAGLAAMTVTDSPARALQMAGAAVGLRRQSGGRYPPWTVGDIDGVQAAGAAALGETAARSEFQGGEAMTREALAALVAGRKPRPQPGTLSLREQQVVRLVASGMTSAEVGRELHLSARTVDNHVFRALTRLGLHSRVQLGRWLADQG